ncbi:hypothetical protein VN97_g984 [Penicillium thymicola]|uniref:BTB domain-containing protein n=1 Tax=Penicillium thymicola TaxID=293382 RepID=A0AAI9XD37_PENTH|nr:hypothetical protein VN97_g984 [Penicillium thymicola]
MELTSYSVEGTDRFVQRLGEFYPTGTFSDLTIYTTDQALKAHRLIVCSRSEAFRRIFSNVRASLPRAQALSYPRAQLTLMVAGS